VDSIDGVRRVGEGGLRVFLGAAFLGRGAGFFFGLKDLDFDFVFNGWDFYANSFESTTLIYEGLIRSVW
jgi:hypothetical protein